MGQLTIDLILVNLEVRVKVTGKVKGQQWTYLCVLTA